MIKIIPKNKKSFSELLGIMFGDGCLSRSGDKHSIYISGNKDESSYINYINSLFKSIFNKETNVGFRKDENTLFIRFSDKNVFDIFKKYLPIGKKYGKLEIPNFILDNEYYFFQFLRGLFDTDGCLVLSKQHKNNPYYPRIEITSKSKRFLKQILLYLKNVGFYGSISSKGGKSYRLELPGFENFSLWRLLINSKNPKNLKKFILVKK